MDSERMYHRRAQRRLITPAEEEYTSHPKKLIPSIEEKHLAYIR